jgi:hypothetical protein
VEVHDPIEELPCHRCHRVWMTEGDEVLNLENQSTTARMTNLLCTLGSPSTKSMAMSPQMRDGMSRGCSQDDIVATKRDDIVANLKVF